MRCFNKKVIGGLALTALIVAALAPRLLGAAVPLLVVAACPLSMVIMMRGMAAQKGRQAAAAAGEPPAVGPANDQDTHQAAQLRELQEEVNRLKAELVLGSDKSTA